MEFERFLANLKERVNNGELLEVRADYFKEKYWKKY